MKTILEANVPGITVTGEPTQDTSGAFEVVNVQSGKKYHSKLSGEGHLADNAAKLQAIINELKVESAESAESAEKAE